MRGLFALWVLAYHLNLHLALPLGGLLWQAGYLGVDGFFILSGCVLSLAHPVIPLRPAAWARFWGRRLRRLYPVHLAVLLLLGGLFLAARALGIAPHDAARASGREFLLQLLMLNGWGASEGWSWNYPSWSISTEWAGYLAFPLLTLALRPIGGRWALMMLGAAMLALCAVAGTSGVGLNLTYAGALSRFFPEFVAGCLIARLAPAVARRRGILCLLALLAFVAGLALRERLAIGDALTVAGLALALAVCTTPVPGGLLRRLPWLAPLGRLSYPLYMGYAPVELLFARFWGHAGIDPHHHPWFWAALMTLALLALALLLARFVERPALRALASRARDR